MEQGKLQYIYVLLDTSEIEDERRFPCGTSALAENN